MPREKPHYPVPREALNQHIGVLGKTRSGKSSVMRAAFVEPLLDEQQPVCIVDPKGDHWGLKSSASGKRAGYPVVIFGGSHADVPINQHSGKQVAELVATGNRPCIVDLGGWRVGERTRFYIDFAETLFRYTRGDRWLVVDEVHNFAPQAGGKLHGDAPEMLHWSNRIASEGLGKGLRLIVASQRPQKVHKDLLTSMETLVAMRVIHPLDRDAIKLWMDGCGDPKRTAEIMSTMAGFERGEAWVWSPEIGFGPERMRFKLFRTYDSFKPQQADAGPLKGWATVDLDEVRAKLEQAVQEAEANDPKFLKKRIRELETSLQREPDQAAQEQLLAANDDLRCAINQRDAQLEADREFFERLGGALAELTATVSGIRSDLELMKRPRAEPETVRAPIDGVDTPARSAGLDPPRRATAADGELGRGERAVLTAIAQHRKVDREQLRVLTGYKRSSRDTYLQKLRARGLITDGWPVSATPDGIAALGDYEPLPTGRALRDYWLQRLGAGEARILQALVDEHPRGLERSEIDERTGYKRSSRDTYLHKLRARHLIRTQGRHVFAAEELF